MFRTRILLRQITQLPIGTHAASTTDLCLTPSVPPLIPAHPSLCKPARSPHLDCSLCSAVDPRVLRASGRAMAQNDRVNEKDTIATELVSTGGFVSKRRAIELPACTPLGTRVCVHLTTGPGSGISPLASAMAMGFDSPPGSAGVRTIGTSHCSKY